MIARRLLSLGPDNKPLYAPLYLQRVGEQWAAMIVGDTVPPISGEVKGLGFFGDTAEDAEQRAKAYLGMAESAN